MNRPADKLRSLRELLAAPRGIRDTFLWLHRFDRSLVWRVVCKGRKQATLISKLEFALKATRTIGRVTDSRKERLKTFVDAAKRGGVGLWCPAYVQALEIVDPEYLRSLGIPAKASP